MRTVTTTSTEEHTRDKKLASGLADRLRTTVDRGRSRSDEFIKAQRRKVLLRDLGEVIYEAHVTGEENLDPTRRDDLLASLDSMNGAEDDDTDS
ncbi:MAG: hypothetical protein HKN07_07790 [Acidimicrobiia bacterium]|nr:hypothetical protein [Acidimicrobiia bacterium]